MNDTFDILMKKTAEGDQRAFRDLATRLSGRMFGLAYRLMGNNASAAEDAVQDALIKLWTSAPNYRPQGKLESYVLTIVHRCCIDLYRKRRPDSEISDIIPDTTPLIETQLIDRSARENIMIQIDRLPTRQRDAVLLSYFEGHTNRSIADILTVSEKAVESLLVRARRNLGQNWPQHDEKINTQTPTGI